MIKVTGFSQADVNFFKMLHGRKDTHKQDSPFILCRNNEIVSVYRIGELLDTAGYDDVILRTWVGKWSSDVIRFSLQELEGFRKNNVNYLVG